MLRVGIVNVTGYAGADLARLLSRHPEVRITSVTGRSQAGQRLGDVFPHLAELGLTIEESLGEVDFAFSALPHKASAEVCQELVARGIPVVDISADFRLHDAEEYREWYKHEHPAVDLLSEAVYGLVELNREEIKRAKLVANPGCYPTSAILALAPALHHGLIDPDIIVDSKSGVSGAGRSLSLSTHYSETNENVSAYGLDGHRHMPEIRQELRKVAQQGGKIKKPVQLTFVPHLIPMTRGILSTSYARLHDPDRHNQTVVRNLYRDFYKGETFVKVVDKPPQTKHTYGSNYCLIYPTVDTRTGRLIVLSVLDNLVKGAAGQAIQNMNLMCGFPESTGIDMLGVYP